MLLYTTYTLSVFIGQVSLTTVISNLLKNLKTPRRLLKLLKRRASPVLAPGSAFAKVLRHKRPAAAFPAGELEIGCHCPVRRRSVLSGIGTDRPARWQPAALDRPGTPGRTRARRVPAVRALT